MTTAEFLAHFFGVLLLGGAAGLVVGLAVPSVRAQLRPVAPELAALVAVGATAGSLYFSEGAGFVPCELCWYQRIAMYPLAVILTVAAFRRDRSPLLYSVILAGIGLVISIYHIQVQLFPDNSSFCDAVAPCSAKWVEGLGFLTIPQMAGISFALIIGLLLLAIRAPRQTPQTRAPDAP